MELTRNLRELAAWYREFAERAGNPVIWHARLTTAEELEREADRLEKIAVRGHMIPRNGAAGRSMAILAFTAGLVVAALGAPEADEPARRRPSAEQAGTDTVRVQPTAKQFGPSDQPDLSTGDARVVHELYRQLIPNKPSSLEIPRHP
jgi:hypothetical protein